MHLGTDVLWLRHKS